MLKATAVVVATVSVLAISGHAAAAEIQVRMLDKGAQGMMVFEPSSAKFKVGDTVRFVPTNPGHNAETIVGMWPTGAAPVKGAMNQEVVVKFAKPGVYGFKCLPHWGFGMVFVAKVGNGEPNAADAEAAVGKAPPMAKKRLAAAFAALK
jgi:pseudoazurin